MLKDRVRKLPLYCFGLDNSIHVLVSVLVGEKAKNLSKLFHGE